MASNTAQATPPPPPARRFNLVRCIATCILGLIVLCGLVVLITWLVIRPRKFVYTLENGSVQNFSLANNHLNATFDFVLKADNPNSKVSIYYDYIESAVTYEDQTVTFNTIDPFFQPHRDVSRVESKLEASNLALSPSTFKDLKVEKSSGEIEVDVRFMAKIRFKVGIWKSNHRVLRILCSPVTVHFSLDKHFENVPCEAAI
ncbi:hypothetical protein PTKIN_Ptkin03bG0056900 [Pterospermum kingtungense]